MGLFCQFSSELSACHHRPSIFSFLDDYLSKYQKGFSSNFVCALILWRSGLGLLMCTFNKFLTVICPPYDGGVFLFHVFNFSEKIRLDISCESSFFCR